MAFNSYPKCDRIQRTIPEVEVTSEIADAIAKGYRTLPIFEKGLYEYTYKKHYSLQTNEYLKCRWAEYKKHCENRVFAPVKIMDVRHYHFYNYHNRYVPPETITDKGDFGMKMRPGPGVDSRGQIPIPQDVGQRLSKGNHKRMKDQTNDHRGSKL